MNAKKRKKNKRSRIWLAVAVLLGLFLAWADNNQGPAPPTKKPSTEFVTMDCTSPDAVHGRNYKGREETRGSTGGTAKERVDRVIEAAREMVKKDLAYAYGGGGPGGPGCGDSKLRRPISQISDKDKFGFDCSGFTQYAFWVGAGIDIGETSGLQYRNGPKVEVSQVSDLRRGDLLFIGAGGRSHVFLYAGDGEILEAAPERVRKTKLSTWEGQYLRLGVRFL